MGFKIWGFQGMKFTGESKKVLKKIGHMGIPREKSIFAFRWTDAACGDCLNACDESQGDDF